MGAVGQLNFWPDAGEGPVWLQAACLDQGLKQLNIPAAGAQKQCRVSSRGSKFAIWNLANSKNFYVVNRNRTPRLWLTGKASLTYLPRDFIVQYALSESPNLENNSNKKPLEVLRADAASR